MSLVLGWGLGRFQAEYLKKGYKFRMEAGSEHSLDRETSISNVQGRAVRNLQESR